MFQQTRILLPMILLVGLMLLIGLLPAGISAQGEPPLPTPTNIGEGGGNGGGIRGGGNGNDGGTPIPPKARIFGFVYDYSNAAYQSGVTVVIDGGGWQVETVTDSNGYYEIGNLGIGKGAA